MKTRLIAYNLNREKVIDEEVVICGITGFGYMYRSVSKPNVEVYLNFSYYSGFEIIREE